MKCGDEFTAANKMYKTWLGGQCEFVVCFS